MALVAKIWGGGSTPPHKYEQVKITNLHGKERPEHWIEEQPVWPIWEDIDRDMHGRVDHLCEKPVDTTKETAIAGKGINLLYFEPMKHGHPGRFGENYIIAGLDTPIRAMKLACSVITFT